MPQDTGSYRTTHQTQYPAEETPELTDWQKTKAAEHFLDNLASQDKQLAQVAEGQTTPSRTLL